MNIDLWRTTGYYISGRRVWLFFYLWLFGFCIEIGSYQLIVGTGNWTAPSNKIFRYRRGTHEQRVRERDRQRAIIWAERSRKGIDW